MAIIKAGSGKSSLTQKYVARAERAGQLLWQSKKHYDTPDEARQAASDWINNEDIHHQDRW